MMVYICSCMSFYKQQTAYEMRISDWSSDVCSSDLVPPPPRGGRPSGGEVRESSRPNPRANSGASRAPPLHEQLGVPLMEWRSEEHTSELQSLMRIAYAVFCLTKQKETGTGRTSTIMITNIDGNRDIR